MDEKQDALNTIGFWFDRTKTFKVEQVKKHLTIDPFFNYEPCYVAETNALITAFYQTHPEVINA